MSLSFDELAKCRKDAWRLVAARQKKLAHLVSSGAAVHLLRQAKAELEEALEVARHANKLHNEAIYHRAGARLNRGWKRITDARG